MRKPEQAPEPSIEEILASIRRIIADDGPSVATAELEENPAPRPGPPGERRVRPMPSAPRALDPRNEDEVLELTEDFMLAEEPAAVELQEPEEPAEVVANGSYGERFDQAGRDPYAHDPYDDGATGRESALSATSASADTAEESADEQPESGFASVMAEVRRMVEVGNAAEPLAQPASPAESRGKPESHPANHEPAPRPAASRWSARQTVGETPKVFVPDIPVPTGRFGRPETTPARDAPGQRQTSFSNRESWSRGVQMPVPEEGPAMPFGSDDGEDMPESSQHTATQPSHTAEIASAFDDAAEADPMAAEERRAATGGVQMRAEELAERAVADFAADRLRAEPPVADFLKGDRPLMEEITSTLADALSKGAGEVDVPEDSAPPLDLSEEGPASGEKRGQQAAPIAADAFNLGRSVNLGAGFTPSPSLHLPETAPASDPEIPELPREEIDDIVPAHRQHVESQYRSTGIVESPVMPHVPAAPGRMSSRPPSGLSASRETGFERLQPSASAPRTLEDTVREMLRPLLVQWLNENMPRIMNEALRDELAAAGLMPRIDDKRA